MKQKLKIYLTHCSAKKDNLLKYKSKQVTPDKMYTAMPIQRFIRTCQKKRVKWAIFSDRYGVWFPNVEHMWYELNPEIIMKSEFKFKKLLNDFEQKLKDYCEIYFYHNPGRFHRLYKKLLRKTKLRDRITLFSHLREII